MLFVTAKFIWLVLYLWGICQINLAITLPRKKGSLAISAILPSDGYRRRMGTPISSDGGSHPTSKYKCLLQKLSKNRKKYYLSYSGILVPSKSAEPIPGISTVPSISSSSIVTVMVTLVLPASSIGTAKVNSLPSNSTSSISAGPFA